MTGYYNTFVVRIWCDKAEETTRGHIQHVSSQDRIHFLNLEDMTDFILSHLKPPSIESGISDEAQEKWVLLTEDYGDVG